MNSAYIDYKLPSLNEYVDICRGNKYAANKYKHKIQDDIGLFLGKMNNVKNYPVTIKYTWYELTRGRDTDNVEFSKKFILDSMVELKILENDSPKFVNGSINEFVYSEKQGVYVEVIER